MTILFIQSSIGTIRLPDVGFDWFDKVVHFIVFGILGYLVARGFSQAKNQFIRHHFFKLSLALTILYGALDEVHQYYVPGRFASFSDWVADALGIIIAVFIFSRLTSRAEPGK